MGENSKISWTDHTFNPWMGCQRVSPGCEHCYAETLVTNRMKLNVWGPPKTTERKRTSESTWRQPLAWDRKAQREGKRAKVFCASLADVFEDHAQVAPWRVELFALIEVTPHLDWQLLTKRPENLRRFLPPSWLDKPRANVWLGTTVEDQKRANERIPHLLATKAVVRFLSCEPLLEAVNLADYLTAGMHRGPVRFEPHRGIDWVIVGGESGSGARRFEAQWARSVVIQCRVFDIACFVKQMGAAFVDEAHGICGRDVLVPAEASPPRRLTDRAGADSAEWPEDLRVQQFPEAGNG